MTPPKDNTIQENDLPTEAIDAGLNKEEFKGLVEVFRTLKKWSDEKEQAKKEKSNGRNYH